MKKVLFVCHGNICRSPMAEFCFREMVEKAGLSGEIQTASAATSGEELGNPVYPPARRQLEKRGISCEGKRARRLTRQDYQAYDLLLGMDRANLRNMDYIWYASPNTEALGVCPEWYEEQYGEPLDMELYEIMAAPQEVLDRCEAYLVLPQETRDLYSELWVELGSN